MIRVVAVAGLDDPRVAEYRSLRRIASLERAGEFVAEGARVVRQLLASRLRVRSLLLEERWLDEFRPLLDAREETIDGFVTTKPELERIVGYHLHQGVMAIAEAPRPPELVPYLSGRPGHVLVALSGVSNAENVGGALRNLVAFGATGLLVDPATCDPFVRRAARVSMGAVFHVPVWRVAHLPTAIAELRRRCGTRAVAAHLYEPVVALDEADLSGSLLVVLGSEAVGLTDDVVRACDAAVRIPMAADRACLNVATSSAIFLWEVARRRRSTDPSFDRSAPRE